MTTRNELESLWFIYNWQVKMENDEIFFKFIRGEELILLLKK